MRRVATGASVDCIDLTFVLKPHILMTAKTNILLLRGAHGVGRMATCALSVAGAMQGVLILVTSLAGLDLSFLKLMGRMTTRAGVSLRGRCLRNCLLARRSVAFATAHGRDVCLPMGPMTIQALGGVGRRMLTMLHFHVVTALTR